MGRQGEGVMAGASRGARTAQSRRDDGAGMELGPGVLTAAYRLTMCY